nr:hypothetical protein [Tanacetum cinerariifolium]
MANPLPNHVENLPDDEQVQPKPVPALLGFAPAVLDIPNNNNGWIEEEPEEDPEMEEEDKEEEEEMDIDYEMDDPKIINPYEIEEGKLPPPLLIRTLLLTLSLKYHLCGSGSSLKVFAHGPIGKDVDTLHHKVKSLAQLMFKRANTEYSAWNRLSEMDRYLGGISKERRSLR